MSTLGADTFFRRPYLSRAIGMVVVRRLSV